MVDTEERKGTLKMTDAVCISIDDLIRGCDKNKPIRRQFTVRMNKPSWQCSLELVVDGWKKKVKVTLEMDEEPSSLKYEILLYPSRNGFGANLFWICPVSGRLAKKLFIAGEETTFMCREAFRDKGTRLYYPQELMGKEDRVDYAIQSLNLRIDLQANRIFKEHYRYKPTYPIKRLDSLENRKEQQRYNFMITTEDRYLNREMINTERKVMKRLEKEMNLSYASN